MDNSVSVVSNIREGLWKCLMLTSMLKLWYLPFLSGIKSCVEIESSLVELGASLATHSEKIRKSSPSSIKSKSAPYSARVILSMTLQHSSQFCRRDIFSAELHVCLSKNSITNHSRIFMRLELYWNVKMVIIHVYKTCVYRILSSLRFNATKNQPLW